MSWRGRRRRKKKYTLDELGYNIIEQIGATESILIELKNYSVWILEELP